MLLTGGDNDSLPLFLADNIIDAQTYIEQISVCMPDNVFIIESIPFRYDCLPGTHHDPRATRQANR